MPKMKPAEVLSRMKQHKKFSSAMRRAKLMKDNANDSWTPWCSSVVIEQATKMGGGNSHQRRIRRRIAQRMMA